MPIIKPLPVIPAMAPAVWEPKHAAAFQALERGEASAHQQTLALGWLMNEACRTYDVSYRPGAGEGDRETSFAEGRRFVGLQVRKMLIVDLAKAQERENNG